MPELSRCQPIENVRKGEIPSAKKTNAIIQAIRELQEDGGRGLIRRLSIFRRNAEDTGIVPPITTTAIGTATIGSGKMTDHTVNRSSNVVSEISAELTKDFHNVGQKFFPRDELFLAADIHGLQVPIQIGGASEIYIRPTGTISGASIATGEMTVGSGSAVVCDLYDVSGTWKLKPVTPTQTITVFNSGAPITSGTTTFLKARYFAGRYWVETSPIFVYALTSAITPGTPSTATCSVYHANDETTLYAAGQSWIGNLTMFDDQVSGDKGICVPYGSKWLAINAPCS